MMEISEAPLKNPTIIHPQLLRFGFWILLSNFTYTYWRCFRLQCKNVSAVLLCILNWHSKNRHSYHPKNDFLKTDQARFHKIHNQWFQGPVNVTAQVGDTVTFKCTASSKPPSTVIIVKIGKFAMRSKQNLTYHVWTCGSIGPVTST